MLFMLIFVGTFSCRPMPDKPPKSTMNPRWQCSSIRFNLIQKVFPLNRHLNKSCQYSFVPDQYNLCNHAHSQEELDEWKERYEWREMKRAAAKDRNMFSYTESLLDEYHSQGDSVNVVSGHLKD